MQINKVKIINKTLFISFSYNPELIRKVKTLTGRRWNPDKKVWSCPDIKMNRDSLIEWGFPIDGDNYLATEIISNLEEEKQEIKFPPHLDKILYDYQKEGVEFIHQRKGRCLIGDEMGLGKTIQALTYLQMNPQKRPAIIICPASLKLNWIKEAKMWMKDVNLYCIDAGKTNFEQCQVAWTKDAIGSIFVINYDQVDKWSPSLLKLDPKTIVIDEVHFIKNKGSRKKPIKRTKSVMDLARKVLARNREVIALSGTPIVNKPIEFFNILNLLEPNIFNNWFYYVKRYCGAYQGRFGWVVSGSTNQEELHNLISMFMIRRNKKDVLTQLPDKIRSVIPIEITNRKQYDYAKDDFISYLKEKKGLKAAEKAKKGAETLIKIEALKQLIVKGKMKAIKKWIEEYLESNNKLVVFCVHLNVIDFLKNEFGNICVEVTGRVSGINRDKAVEDFQNNPSKRLFLGNKAAGVGLTLTAADSTCTIELPWSPGDCDQQEDRVHRIGQESDKVNAFYLIGQDTIEEDIMALLDKKRKVLDAVLDGKVSDEESLLTELIRKWEND